MAAEKLIEVSFSELKSFRRCQKMHNYKYVQDLQKKSKSLPLYKGSVIHSCLEEHYKGGDWKKAWKVFKKEFEKLMDEEKAAYGDLPADVSRMISGYIRHYKSDVWSVVKDKNGKPIVEREFKLRIPGTRIVVKGVIDLIIADDYGIWVVDHKSIKRNAPSDEFRMSDVQTTLYFWVVLTLCEEWGIPKEDLMGAIFNYIRTEPPKEPDILQNGEVSRRQIDTSWSFYKRAILAAGKDPKDYLDMKKKLQGNESRFYHRHRMDKPKALLKVLLQEAVFTAYQIEALAESKMVARSLDWTCDRYCDFREICYSELQGFDTDSIIKTLYERRETDGIKARKEKERKGLIDRDEI